MTRARALTAALIYGLAVASSAQAEKGKLVDFSLGLSSRAPAAPSGMGVSVLFHTAGDPDKKSSPIRSVVIAAPAGTKIDTTAMPQCAASDEELRRMGSEACPPETKAGQGTYSAILGFGPPLDPFVGDNHVFNADKQLIEVITVKDSTMSPGFDRLTVKDNTLTANPPVTPGGPPDGETATRSIEFTIPVRNSAKGTLVTTPPACPESGYWESTGTFGFADGRAETVVSRTPCQGSTSSSPGPPSPTDRPGKRCLKGGKFTLRVPYARRDHNKRVRLSINGRVVRKVSRSARRVRVNLSRRPAGRYRVSVHSVTASGRHLSRRRTIRTCG